MSKPLTNIEREKFEDLLSYQCTKEDIAGFFHVSEKTIARFCQREYQKTFKELADEYNASGRVSLRRAQYASAMAGNVQMQIFLGKQWLGQSDRITQDVKQDVALKADMSNVIIKYQSAESFSKESTRSDKTESEPDQTESKKDEDPDPADITPEDIDLTLDEETEAAICEKVKKLVLDKEIRKKVKDTDTRIMMSIGMRSLMEVRAFFVNSANAGIRPAICSAQINAEKILSEKYDIDYQKGNGCSCSEHFHTVPYNRQLCTLCQSNLDTPEKCTWEHTMTLVYGCDPNVRELAERYKEDETIQAVIDDFIDNEIDEDAAFSFRNILQKARFITDDEIKELLPADSFS